MTGTDDSAILLSDGEMERLGISTAEAIAAIEAAIRAEAAGTLWTAPKAAVVPGDGRYMMATLSTADDPGLTVVKSVMVSPDNPAKGLPAINGAILLLDSTTGRLRGLLGANWVTAVRTACLSAVVARRLAKPDAASIAFVGCGVQALSHLAAFCELFPIRGIRAFGRGSANAEALCAAARARGLEATRAATAQEALEGADLVVTSITLNFETAPFLDARWLPEGAFAAITDLGIPWLPEGMSAFDRIVIDDMAQEKASPKPMVDPALVLGDLGQLVTGQVTAEGGGRSAFIFRGLAIGDFALAALAYRRAVAAGVGTALPDLAL